MEKPLLWKGGNYRVAFCSKSEKLFAINWDDVKGRFYTTESGDDYANYVSNSNEIYCLTENTADVENTGNYFYVASIIDIYGGDCTVYNDNYESGKVKSVGELACQIAAGVTYKYNKWSGGAGAGYWISNGGWKDLYDELKDEIGDSNVQGIWNYDENENLIDEECPKDIIVKYYNLSNLNITKNGEVSLEVGEFDIDGITYNTKLGKYTMTKNDDLPLNINVKVKEETSEYEGIIKDGYIYVKEELTNEIEYIDIKQSYNGYRARLIILGSGMNQTRMVAYGEDEYEISNTARTTDVPDPQINVSLQKYITKVTDANGKVKYESDTDRKNKYADTDNNLTSDTNKKHQGVDISNQTGEKLAQGDTETTYKNANAVSIEAGDKVEYTIKIYNNAKVKANNVVVKDNIGNIGIMKSSYTRDTDNNSIYEIFNGNIDAGGIETKTVEVQYDTYTDSVIMNKAWISNADNKAEYRTIDADYVQMKKYSVSLEKYVTEVKKDENNKKQYTNRVGKRYNDAASSNDYKNEYKLENKVGVEPGDKVIFTIKLTNTSTTTNVKISEIYDSFTCITDETSNKKGLKLVYDELYGIQGNGGGTRYNYHYGDDENDENKNIDRYLIKFNNPTLIEPGKSVDVTIKFEVEVPDELIKAEQTLRNVAAIVELKNQNDKPVQDSDGTDNNRDQDYIETKTYAVSLEKYVSKVNEKTYDSERSGKAEYLTKNTSGQYVDNTKNDTKWTQKNYYKYNNVVTVSNGDELTYTINVKNDGDTDVKNIKVEDTLPTGVEYIEYEPKENIAVSQNSNKLTISINKTISKGNTETVKIKVKVTESNMSVNILENIAEITEMHNSSGKEVKDTTPYNNKDKDYIQLDFEGEPEKTSYTVIKKWVTNGNERPAQITVKLLKIKGSDEKDLGKESIILSDLNNWTYTWNDLDKLDDGWTYIVRELNEAGTDLLPGSGKYNDNITVTYVDNSTAKITTITNTIETPPPPPPGGDETYYSVEKVWQDNDNASGERPNSVTVRLYKQLENGTLEKVTKDKDDTTLENDGKKTLSEGNWTYTWNNLPKYDNNGNLIKYIAKELKISIFSTTILEEGKKLDDNYTVSYIHRADKTIIYNTYEGDNGKGNDLIISGVVWNDMALDKTSSTYNGIKDEQESYLSGITVNLYRVDKGIVATTTTDENGEYCFTNDDLDKTVLTEEKERYIKGPTKSNTDNKWEGTYYSYYVIFEYDGITYTSTSYTEFGDESDEKHVSNAQEDAAGRLILNGKFSTINNESGITYTTVNKAGYIPQSIHVYDSNTMKMQSSTKLITLSDSEEIVKKLKHVDLGLRGKDIFDLELTSDVYSTKVTVNGVSGGYNYNSNKITVRRNDCNNYSYLEDSANIYAQTSDYIGERYNQYIRNSDITNSAYDTIGLAIEVTYKITIRNASITPGTATKIINYYDNKYTLKGAYSDSSCKTGLTTGNEGSGTGYKSVEITTPGTTLKQSEKIEIYVVYTLNDAANTLQSVTTTELATFNMAEISEYKTECGTGQSEATRGLIDKDSAPGSAATENVRLTPNLIGSSNTVEYYFSGNDLSKLKYEDDTYATPTLYFVKDDDERTITGTVFEDNTTTNSTTKIKTGNGVMDSGEVGVYGATVRLIEKNGENEAVRYETTTNAKGKFSFSGFLPGNYIIRYYYGDTTNTVLLNQNSKSYNGEDFQATNNKYKIDGMDTNQLNTTANYWYIFNEKEGVSTATDSANRRETVSKNVTIYSNEKMSILNNIRAGKENDINEIINDTKMWANTQEMLLTVEESINLNDYDTNKITGKYEVIDETKNIATWTIFPSSEEDYKEYKIENMNFGIAEVPVTTIDLKKSISKFTITDSTGQNVLAGYEEGKTNGNVITASNITSGNYWVQIEDEKLQGAKLEITYKITLETEIELNFDNSSPVVATVKGIVDFIDNDLSYNKNLGDNDKYWEVTTYNDTLTTLKKMAIEDSTPPKGTIDPEGDKYATTVKAKTENPLVNGGTEVTITLEKVLTASNSTIDQIITSTVSSFEYSNIVEIIEIDYTNTKTGGTTEGEETTGGTTGGSTGSGTSGGDSTSTGEIILRDRVRTTDRYIILPGTQYDNASSEELIITPPTGDTSISIQYYIITAISLAVLALGIFGIKKFAIKK